MSQDTVDDVLILNTGDDFDGSTAATANLNVDIEHAPVTTRLLPRAWAQILAAWHSAGVLTTAFAPVLSALPRVADGHNWL